MIWFRRFFPVGLFLAIACRAVIRRGPQNAFQFARGFAGLAGMRLIHDHCIAPCRNRRLPRSGLCFFFVAGLVLILRACRVQQAAQHERELLQRGYDDLGAVDQRIGLS